MPDIKQQAEKAADTWNILKRHGVNEQTVLVIDLFWYAKDASNANALAAKLRTGIAHFTDVKQLRGEWSITAQTFPGAFGTDSLEQLVRDMNALGAAYNCDFDGFGTAIPEGLTKKPWWKFW